MRIEIIKQGRYFFQGDICFVEEAGCRLVWKDYRKFRGSLMAPVGLYLVARERSILRRLSGRFSPVFMPHPDPLILSMTYIEGRAPTTGDMVPRELIDALLDHLWVSGICHNDLHRSNVVWDGQQVFLVDFTSAIYFPKSMRWAGFSWLHKRDRLHAYKVLRMSGAIAPYAENPRWIRYLQRGWKAIYKKTPAEL